MDYSPPRSGSVRRPHGDHADPTVIRVMGVLIQDHKLLGSVIVHGNSGGASSSLPYEAGFDLVFEPP